MNLHVKSIPSNMHTLQFQLRKAAKARLYRMVKTHPTRKDLDCPDWVKREWKGSGSMSKDEIADLLRASNFNKDCLPQTSVLCFGNRWLVNIERLSWYHRTCVSLNVYKSHRSKAIEWTCVAGRIHLYLENRHHQKANDKGQVGRGLVFWRGDESRLEVEPVSTLLPWGVNIEVHAQAYICAWPI